MHYTTITLITLVASKATAFPSRMFDMGENERRALDKISAQIEASAQKPRQLETPGFSESQYVSNQGTHAYVAPGPTDLRGPCPGLNAMANHNYIPHNGVATISQFIQGTNDVFGMGLDLATFLAVYGAVFDGDLTSVSLHRPNIILWLMLSQAGQLVAHRPQIY